MTRIKLHTLKNPNNFVNFINILHILHEPIYIMWNMYMCIYTLYMCVNV
jgi:hypothetical protein